MGRASGPHPSWRARLLTSVAAIAVALGLSLAPGWPAARVAANDCNGVSFATNDAVTTNEDTTVAVPVFANDLCIDGVSGVSVSIVSSPSHGTLQWDGFPIGFHYTPNQDYNGSDSFQYRFVSLEYPDYSTGTVYITINPVNDHPYVFFSIASDCYPSLEPTVAEDSGPYSHDCSLELRPGGGADEVGQTVRVVVTGYDASLFAVPPHFDGAGNFGFTPAPNANGHTLFTWYAKDDGGTANGGINTDPQHYSGYIAITPVDDAPVAKADSYVAKPGVSTTIPAPGVLANDKDVDGPALSAHLASLPAHGTLDLLASGSFTYHPDPTFSGTDSFTYTASDGTLSSAPTKVTLTVSATATAPPPPTTAPSAAAGSTPGASASATQTDAASAAPTGGASAAPPKQEAARRAARVRAT
jgi:hypothetical protein